MMTENKESLLLLDTFGLIYRLYYTMPAHMKSPDGRPVNAVFGLARVLLKIAVEMKPDYLVPAMESKSETFRHKEYPEYKAHRDKMPDDLRAQIPMVEELISAMGLATAAAEGFEADDVIGTLSRIGVESGMDVRIITGDRDLLQLVGGGATALMTRKGVTDLEEFDREKVKESLGVYPERVPDKKGLEGDSSDNIPGVPGVGGKTAEKLLEQFDNLEAIYENLSEVKGAALKKKLEENKELAFLSRRLATIERNVPLELEPGTGLERHRLGALDANRLAEFFHSLGFDSLIKELGVEAEQSVQAGTVAEQLQSEYRLVFDEGELRAFLERAREAGRLCVDLETMGLDQFTDPIVGYSLAVKPGEAIYVPVRHERGRAASAGGDLFSEPEESGEADELADKQLDPEKAIAIMKPYFEDPKIEITGHNVKFDLLMIRAAGSDFAKVGGDTFLASYLIDPSSRRYGLKRVAAGLLNIRMRTYEDVAGTGKDQILFSKVRIADALDYACADVDTVLRIEKILDKDMEEKNLTRVYREIELPLVQVLAEMEWNGISIDSAALGSFSVELEEREREIESKIRAMTGVEVNPKSPKQVAELLFDRLGLPKIQKLSTDFAALDQLKDLHDVVPLIMEHRHISKLRGTYVDALPAAANKKTGRIHTSFNQTLTATGRLSSSNPNLQNIPIRTGEGREVRRAFIPGADGCVFLSADYSQVEARILAHMSGDETLIDSFKNREDIHRRTAAEVFGVPQDEVTTDQRRYAKTINFGIIYGQTEYGLSQQLGISRAEAGDFIRKYLNRYSRVRDFVEATKEEAARDGYVTTLFGRRRYIEEVKSANSNQREAGFRAAVNTRIQGTAADVMKLAMIKIYRMIKAGELFDAKMLLQVHDELVFEVRREKLATVAAAVKSAMETASAGWVDFQATLEADVKSGDNWNDMDPVAL